MIERFNRRQSIRALTALVLGLLATAATTATMFFSMRYLLGSIDLHNAGMWSFFITVAAMLEVFVVGWSRWRRGFGCKIYLGSDPSSDGAELINDGTVEAPSSGGLVSRLALSAPLQLLKSFDLFRSRIVDPSVATDLEVLLAEIQRRKGWHPLADYGSRRDHVFYLIRMGQVDFSPRKGVVKAAGLEERLT
jgi:hypothetical protein